MSIRKGVETVKRSRLGRLPAALLMALVLAVLCVACGGKTPVTGPDVPDTAAPSEIVTEPAETPPTAGPALPEATPPAETEPQETEPPETVPPETEPPETEPLETAPPEAAPPETIPPMTEPPEMEPPETEPPATEPPETGPVETTPPETEPPVEAEKDENTPTFTVEETEYVIPTSAYAHFGGGNSIDITIVPTCSHKKSALSASSDAANDAVYGKGNWYRTIADHYAFESSDESIVSVDANGRMTSTVVMHNGDTPKTAYITVTHKADGTKLKIKITITLEPYYDIDDAYIAAYAAEMLRLVNEARREAGVPEVTYPTDPAYQEVVNERAKELADHYSHVHPNGGTINDMQTNRGLDDYFGRENIANGGFENKGQTTLESPESVARSFFSVWMSDNDHKGPSCLKAVTKWSAGSML